MSIDDTVPATSACCSCKPAM